MKKLGSSVLRIVNRAQIINIVIDIKKDKSIDYDTNVLSKIVQKTSFGLIFLN